MLKFVDQIRFKLTLHHIFHIHTDFRKHSDHSSYYLCKHGHHDIPFEKFMRFILSLQTCILLLIWYLQIYRILINTKFKISKISNIIFIFLFSNFILLQLIAVVSDTKFEVNKLIWNYISIMACIFSRLTLFLSFYAAN